MNQQIPKSVFFCATLLVLCGSGCGPSLPDEVAEVYTALPEKIDFNFHIRPLLADRCFKCHGPDDDAREADLRLDLEETAFTALPNSGSRAFVSGNLQRSEVWHRITSVDPTLQMPPTESNLSLSPREKALMAKWIRQGAEWKDHWAFIAPKKPEIPPASPTEAFNPIDHFILAKLKEHALTPSPLANKERLIRRLTLDLTGLPPSIEEIEAFLTDGGPDAYENLVDRLLSSEAHAERLAMEWLDVARFGDTQGLHLDAERYNWPWRDWVIRAFEQNMPYDEFITWQIAGDLLPNASRAQRLATAFHRNHPVSAEGGIVDEEFRQMYVQDRTNTTATAFLGLTMECAACHDHKFDPISQKEYYAMSAFFNNLKEVGLVSEFRINKKGGPVHPSGPVMSLPDAETEEELAHLSAQIASLRSALVQTKKEMAASKNYISELKSQPIEVPQPQATYPFESIQPHTMKRGVVHRIQVNRPIDKKIDRKTTAVACGDPLVVPGKIGNAIRSPNEMDLVFLRDVGNFQRHEPYSAGAWINMEREGVRQSIMGNSGELGSAWRGWDLSLDSLNRLTIKLISLWPQNYIQVTSEETLNMGQWRHVLFTYDGSSQADGLHLYIDGEKASTFTEYDRLYGSIVRNYKNGEEWQERPIMVFRSGRYYTGENGVFAGSIDQIHLFKDDLTPLEVAALYRREANAAHHSQSATVTPENWLHHQLKQDKGYNKLMEQLRSLLAKELTIRDQVPEIMVMEEMPVPRKTYVLNRGQYDQPTEMVVPATPEQVLAFSDRFPNNRLGLAKWLTDPANPLTARVAVNRYWQMIFGRGMVETPHDFGTQGALPSHPDLLDWLSLRFQESGWNVRALLKNMVMSRTYRQSSAATEAQSAKDPRNVLLARAPSYRYQAEVIRDNALAASGLLNRKVGGPSVKPYQPEGIWDFGGLVSGRYEADQGADLYRRSMYTYIRRTSPHPAMVAFDAPNRAVCTVKRENTNTPLQALVLLNDPQFVEASRVLAQRMQKEGGVNFEDQVTYGFRLLCGRKPNGQELELMRAQFEKALAKYEMDLRGAEALLEVGEYPRTESLDVVQTAALTMVANLMMNFDESYMRR